MFRLPMRYSLIVTALGLALGAAFLLVFLDLFARLMKGDFQSIIPWLIGNMVLLFFVAIVIAVIISAITWGYWLGDLGGERGRRSGHDRSEEARAALEVLEKKYADREITMSEYLALRKGIERDRPRF